METNKLWIRIPPRVKGKLSRAAERANRNMSDLVVSWVAEEFGVAYEATGKAYTPVGPSVNVMLYMPQEVRDAVDLRMEASGETARDVVVRVICERLKMEFQPGGRWPKTAAA